GRFSKKYPRIKINLQIVQRREVGVASRSMHYDMGFTAIPFDFPNLAVRRTFTMPARALIPTSHRLATRRAISIRDFEGENLIMLTKDNSIRPKLELELLKANISFASTMETSSPIVAYKLVSQGLGLSVVDPFSPMVMNSDEVANLRLNGDISLTYGFFFPERKPVSRLCEDFMLILGDIVQAYGQN
ncbi:MAG TPA: LysR substrate-binding domain-containing protein, partial [Roseomonas sp.]